MNDVTLKMIFVGSSLINECLCYIIIVNPYPCFQNGAMVLFFVGLSEI